MKLTAIAATALLGLLGATAAHGADLYTQQAHPVPGLGFLPAGAYVSLDIGAAVSDTKLSSSGLGMDAGFAGFSSDVRLGYDYRLPRNPFVVGAFVGFGFENVKGTVTAASASQDFGWDIGGRVGYVTGKDAMVYALAAYRQQNISLTGAGSAAISGPEAGGGLEIDYPSGMLLKTEFTYTWFGNWKPGTMPFNITEEEGKATVGIGFRF